MLVSSCRATMAATLNRNLLVAFALSAVLALGFLMARAVSQPERVVVPVIQLDRGQLPPVPSTPAAAEPPPPTIPSVATPAVPVVPPGPPPATAPGADGEPPAADGENGPEAGDVEGPDEDDEDDEDDGGGDDEDDD